MKSKKDIQTLSQKKKKKKCGGNVARDIPGKQLFPNAIEEVAAQFVRVE